MMTRINNNIDKTFVSLDRLQVFGYEYAKDANCFSMVDEKNSLLVQDATILIDVDYIYGLYKFSFHNCRFLLWGKVKELHLDKIEHVTFSCCDFTGIPLRLSSMDYYSQIKDCKGLPSYTSKGCNFYNQVLWQEHKRLKNYTDKNSKYNIKQTEREMLYDRKNFSVRLLGGIYFQNHVDVDFSYYSDIMENTPFGEDYKDYDDLEKEKERLDYLGIKYYVLTGKCERGGEYGEYKEIYITVKNNGVYIQDSIDLLYREYHAANIKNELESILHGNNSKEVLVQMNKILREQGFYYDREE